MPPIGCTLTAVSISPKPCALLMYSDHAVGLDLIVITDRFSNEELINLVSIGWMFYPELPAMYGKMDCQNVDQCQYQVASLHARWCACGRAIDGSSRSPPTNQIPGRLSPARWLQPGRWKRPLTHLGASSNCLMAGDFDRPCPSSRKTSQIARVCGWSARDTIAMN